MITSSVPETFTAFSRTGSGVMRVRGEERGRRGRDGWRNEIAWMTTCRESSVTSEKPCCCCGWDEQGGKSM